MISMAYVVMPVGSDSLYPKKRAAIEAGTSAAGYTAYFPLDKSPVGIFDLEKAKAELKTATAVIVDLTHERPSCYYELGLAQALHSRVFVFAERGTRLHQLYEREQVYFYGSLDDFTNLVIAALR
jgi:hypothetical protein